ncbi:MAG TPA: hypothetical protein VFV87_19760 [Pirellulaceae bacterium]|nr:hypothetical protein [Pirellulaceae bacterium]
MSIIGNNSSSRPADALAQQYKYLAPKPKSAYKQLFVKGRGIFARTLYGAYMSEEMPMTPEEIAADRDLPVEAVLEAIAYCESNPPEIEEDFRREEALMKATGLDRQSPSTPYTYQPLTPQQRAAIHRNANLP